MTSLLLCWYALGYVACGLNFALLDKSMRPHACFCLITGPGMIVSVVAFRLGYEIAKAIPPNAPSKQYMWRKP